MRKLVIICLAGLLSAVSVAVAASSHDRGAGPPFSSVSNAGKPIRALPGTAAVLARFHISPDLRSLGRRGHSEFLVGTPTAGSGTCFVVGAPATSGFAPEVAGCQGPGHFPSREEPIIDFSLRSSPNDHPEIVYVEKLRGFAADGITTVSVVDVTGAVYSTPVVSNVFERSDIPHVRAAAIVARDSSGSAVLTIRLSI